MILLMLVPVQGMTAIAHALVCVDSSELAAHDAPASHGDGAHDHGTAHQHDSHDGSAGNAEHASMQCCHHFSSAAAPAFPVTGDVHLPVFQSSITLLETLYFPDQPRRPPRA